MRSYEEEDGLSIWTYRNSSNITDSSSRPSPEDLTRATIHSIDIMAFFVLFPEVALY